MILVLAICKFSNQKLQIIDNGETDSIYSNYALGDNPLGVLWFIHVADIHLEKDDYMYLSFKFVNIKIFV